MRLKTAIPIIFMIGLWGISGCHRQAEQLIIPGKTAPEKAAFLRLSIQGPNEVTLRAPNTDAMQSVNMLRLVFCSTDTEPVVQHVRELVVSDPAELSSITLKLPPNDYQLLVLANPTNKVRELTRQGASIRRITTGAEFKTSDLYTTSGENLSSVVMSNEQGLVSINKNVFEASNAATLSPTAIKLEPVLARVIAYGTPVIQGGKAGKSPAGYLINNVPKQTAIPRPLAKLFGGNTEVAGDASDPINRYAGYLVPEATPTTTEAFGHQSITNMKQDKYWRDIRANLDVATADRSHQLAYTKENAIPENYYLQGTAPCVVIRFSYIPDGLTLADNEGWLSFRGKLYKETEVKAVLNGSNTQHADLKQALETSGITMSSLEEGFEKDGIKYYYKGYSYYVVYIRHFAGATKDNPYGLYGVIRGNEYRIKINNISGVGLPTPPDLSNPSTALKPILEQKSSQLGVSILPVANRDQQVDL